jgi:tRNA-splicing ligase RtcB (3'-phosphate/5'-hydroxy nucleic acid ligase)
MYRDYDVVDEAGVPIKMWTRGVPVEDKAIDQLKNLANMPFIYKHVAAMPDVHVGIGATVGSVIATRGAIIPAAVGVDIGCGMMAAKLNISADLLPDNLAKVRSCIESMIPHGRTDNGGLNDRGAWGEVPDHVGSVWSKLSMDPRWNMLATKYPMLTEKTNNVRHLGTLGTGNHFVELCVDTNNGVWIMLHSGSRGVGNKIGQTFIDLAKRDMERYFINLPDKDLSYLVEGTEHFDDYCSAVSWAQDFARSNRGIMMDHALRAVRKALAYPIEIDPTSRAVNCHHNYIDQENHYGANVWVTRKGAVRAREGDLGIIPGSMGARSFIVRGLGNKESFCSCSHGAGRKMSRGEAMRKISLEEHIAATQGVECRKDEGVIDESPAAYKSIDDVMKAQASLVEIVAQLKQVVCVKG